MRGLGIFVRHAPGLLGVFPHRCDPSGSALTRMQLMGSGTLLLATASWFKSSMPTATFRKRKRPPRTVISGTDVPGVGTQPDNFSEATGWSAF